MDERVRLSGLRKRLESTPDDQWFTLDPGRATDSKAQIKQRILDSIDALSGADHARAAELDTAHDRRKEL